MNVTVCPYTRQRIPDVLDFEKRLREEESFWGWEIDDAYVRAGEARFEGHAFDQALSLLAYDGERVVGRIDAALIASRFDGSVKAYLDWICVVKSARHHGVAQRLLEALRAELKDRGITTLVGLTASNEEAQRFYRNVPDARMRDTGIWIDII